MNPSYTIRDDSGALVEIGEVQGSKPCVLPPERKSLYPPATMRTTDILGAMAGSKGLGVFAESHTRKDFRQSNKTDDIEGAHSGSLKKGPSTKRVCNPLDPSYEVPGQKELGSE